MPHFIGTTVDVRLDEVMVARSRANPAAFVWEGQTHTVRHIRRRWREQSPPRWRRHGKRTGTRWHVSSLGRDYFQIETDDARYFELYYDRQLDDSGLSGRWILWRELLPDDLGDP